MYASCCVALLLVLLLNADTTSGAAFVTPYKQYKANLKGTTLVLDVNSLVSEWSPNCDAFGPGSGCKAGPPHISSVEPCMGTCDLMPGCTGYTYCAKDGGCGSGCKAYAAKNPTPKLGPSWAAGLAKRNLPYSWFGPYGSTKGCQGDKWPRGMCSLKVASSTTNPQFWSKNAAEGWVSGVVERLPAACNGISAATCDACKKSKNPAACYKCALKASTAAAKREAAVTGYPYLTWADGCSVCVSLPAASQATCVNCLAKDQPCGQCAYDKLDSQKIDLPTCLACSIKYPKAYAKCSTCAQAKTAAARLACSK